MLFPITQTWVSEWKMAEWINGGLHTRLAVVMLMDYEQEAMTLKQEEHFML